MKTITYILFVLSFLLISICQAFGQPEPIAHALGSIGGYTYTNSREALVSSIEKGYKYIEVDIDSTSEGIFVATHGWAHFNKITNNSILGDSILSIEDFSSRKIYNKYTPITIQELVDTLKNHTDISLMTDKISDPDIIDRCFSDIKERLYVECFTADDYFELKRRGYNVMFSGRVADYMFNYFVMNLFEGNGRIDFIAVKTTSNFKEIRRLRCLLPFKIAMFTINSKDFLDEHYDDIDFFYTDFYDPKTGTFNTAK